MRHEEYKELIQLSVYDEISSDNKKLLEDHLLECEECSKEYESIKQLYVAIAENAPKQLNENVLESSRDLLFSSITEDEKKSSLLTKLLDLLEELVFGRYAFAVGGVSALVVGIFLGKLFFTVETQPTPSQSISLDELIGDDVNIANIKLPNNWDKKKQIEINFDAVKSVSLTANLDDPIVKMIVAKSIVESESSWNRIQTLNKISDKNNITFINDPKIKGALLTALTEDQNPAVRKEAIESVKMLEYDDNVRDALLYVLANDENSGMRVAAINMIAKQSSNKDQLDDELKSILDRKQNNDDNSFVRLKAASLLERN